VEVAAEERKHGDQIRRNPGKQEVDNGTCALHQRNGKVYSSRADQQGDDVQLANLNHPAVGQSPARTPRIVKE